MEVGGGEKVCRPPAQGLWLCRGAEGIVSIRPSALAKTMHTAAGSDKRQPHLQAPRSTHAALHVWDRQGATLRAAHTTVPAEPSPRPSGCNGPYTTPKLGCADSPTVITSPHRPGEASRCECMARLLLRQPERKLLTSNPSAGSLPLFGPTMQRIGRKQSPAVTCSPSLRKARHTQGLSQQLQKATHMRSLVAGPSTVQAGALGPAQPLCRPNLCSHSDSLGGKTAPPCGSQWYTPPSSHHCRLAQARKQQTACQVFLCRWLQQHHEKKGIGGYKGGRAHNT